MNEYPDFEQDYYSRTAKGLYKIGYVEIRLLKYLAHDKPYENNIFYDLLAIA